MHPGPSGEPSLCRRNGEPITLLGLEATHQGFGVAVLLPDLLGLAPLALLAALVRRLVADGGAGDAPEDEALGVGYGMIRGEHR